MTKPTTILFYYGNSSSSSMTGGPRTVMNLMNSLDRSQFTPILVTLCQSPLSEEAQRQGIEVLMAPLPPILTPQGEQTLRYPLWKKIWSLQAFLQYNRHIEAIGRERDVKIIWGRNIKSVLFIAWAARRLGRPLIWDIGLEKPSRGVMRVLHWFGLMTSAKIVTQAESQPQSIFGFKTARRFAAKFRAIYPGLDDERVALLEQAAGRYQQRQQRALHDGDEQKSAAHIASPTASPFNILCIATIHPRKNQLLLLRALTQIVERHPEVHVQFAGSIGDPVYSARLEEYIDSHKLQSHATLLGWREDIPDLISQSNLLVLCSHNEGVPHVVREAMWVGAPVAATAVGGLPDIIRHGETGFLVADDDVASLRDVITLCLEQPATLDAVAQRGQIFARQRFSLDSWATTYHELFMQILQEHVLPVQ